MRKPNGIAVLARGLPVISHLRLQPCRVLDRYPNYLVLGLTDCRIDKR